MEANNNDNSSSQISQQPEDEDRLSALTDDILLSILKRVGSSRRAVRTTVLSTRWRHLPWSLPELTLNARQFLPVPSTQPTEPNGMEKLAMESFTKATRSLLAYRQRDSTVLSLHLKLYLINASLCEVGAAVGDAANSGLLKDLNLTVLDKANTLHRCITYPSNEHMMQRAQEIHTFFCAYPSVLRCVTKLSLVDAGFDKLDMHHVLFDCCKQLKQLSLTRCDTGENSVFKIDAPNSKLRVLIIEGCRFKRLDLVCLPRLEKFICATWVYDYAAPVTFGFVPSLGELELSCGASYDENTFKLSDLLRGITSIHTLKLDFKGEILWLQPEMEELRTAFKNLQKLSVCGVFVEFDILWTTAFLVAAPSIEKLRIQVWKHACDVGEFRGGIYRDRRSPEWILRFDESKNRLLREVEFGGFRSLEQQFTYIRSILERSPNLKKIVLRGDKQCRHCKALDASLRPSNFPKKDEQDMVVKRIRDGRFSPEIIFDEYFSLNI